MSSPLLLYSRLEGSGLLSLSYLSVQEADEVRQQNEDELHNLQQQITSLNARLGSQAPGKSALFQDLVS